MRAKYDFSGAKKNPYASRLTRAVTVQLDADASAYFEQLAADAGVPVETLMRLYLAECAATRKRLRVTWGGPSKRRAA